MKTIANSKQIKTLFFAFITSLLILTTQVINANNSSYVVIVNAQNTKDLNGLKRSQIRNIFLMNKTKWKNGDKTKPIFPKDNTKQYKVLLKNVLKMNTRKLNHHWLQIKQRTGTSAPPFAGSDSETINYVGNNSGAIGIIVDNGDLPPDIKVLLKL